MLTFAGTFRLMGQLNPLGGEFRVNTATTQNQQYVTAAGLPAGGFVVVWASNTGSGSSYDIDLQRYSSTGVPLGGELRVNTYTTGSQRSPAVAAWAGGFIIVWTSAQDGAADGIVGQRFDASGGTLGGEFLVNTYTTSTQRAAAVAADTSGAFVVVWASSGVDGNLEGVVGQRYTSAGAPDGSEYHVNTYTTGTQTTPSVAYLPSGGSVVVWTGSTGSDGSGVIGQRYDATGASAGGEFLVNTYTTSSQFQPSVSSAPNGDFVVVWTSLTQDGGNFGVFGQRYSSSGASFGGEFRVSSYTTNNQDSCSVAANSAGSFVVVWESSYQFGGVPAEGPQPLGGVPFGAGVFSLEFSGSGSLLGSEFRVNTYTTQGQGYPRVAVDSTGTFLVVWVSTSQAVSRDIFAQRYCETLASVTIALAGSASACPGGMGGTASVSDTGGGPVAHQWGYRMTSGGAVTDLTGQTAAAYTLNAADFAAPGAYFLVETTTPPMPCGLPIVSNEIAVQIGDASPPVVTAPIASTVTQTLCQ